MPQSTDLEAESRLFTDDTLGGGLLGGSRRWLVKREASSVIEDGRAVVILMVSSSVADNQYSTFPRWRM